MQKGPWKYFNHCNRVPGLEEEEDRKGIAGFRRRERRGQGGLAALGASEGGSDWAWGQADEAARRNSGPPARGTVLDGTPVR